MEGSPDIIEFALGETVYHRCNTESPGIVTGHVFLPSATLIRVAWGPMQLNDHYSFELTKDKEFILQ